MTIQTLSKFVSTPLLTVLVYGKTGTGKTTLMAKAAAFDEFAPLEIIDFDLRLDGLVESVPPALLERVRFQSYRDAKIPGEAYDRAWSRLRELEDRAGQPDMPRTVFLDSLTFMGKSFLDMVVYLDSSKGGNKGTEKFGELVASKEHYGPQMQHIERFIQRLTGLKQKGYNVFVSAHEDPTKDETTGYISKAVDTTGKLVNRLPGYFNEYWHSALRTSPTGQTEYLIGTKATDAYEARTAFTSFLSPIELQDGIWTKITNHLRQKQAK